MFILNRKIKVVILFLIILTIASFFRLWQIKTLPAGLFPDEAANGLDINLIFQGYHTPFFERGLGREALFFYLQAISVKLFGIGVWPMRLVSALIGIFSVIAAWFLAKKMFNERVAFIAAFFMAVSTWHVTLSRTGFRAILIPLFSTLFFYFAYLTIKETQTKKRFLWTILAGLNLGLGFYTYISFRAMIPIILLLAIVLLTLEREVFRKFWKEIIIATLSAFLIMSPLISYFLSHPGSFMGRAGYVSVFNPDQNQGDLIGTFFEVAKKTFLMFFTEGDLNWRHNVSGYSMLNPIVSALFGLFIVGCFWILVKEKFWQIRIFKNKLYEKYFKHLFLVVWFLGMLGPELMTAQAIPHGLRAIGAMPAVFIFSALTFDFLWLRTISFLKNDKSKLLFNISLVMLLMSVLVYDFTLYFGISANSPEFYYAYRSDLTIVSNYLNQRNLKEKTYLVLDEYSVQTPEFLTSSNHQPYILVEPATSYKTKLSDDDQIVFTQSTIFDTKKYQEENPEVKLFLQEFNQFGEEIMRVYELP